MTFRARLGIIYLKLKKPTFFYGLIEGNQALNLWIRLGRAVDNVDRVEFETRKFLPQPFSLNSRV